MNKLSRYQLVATQFGKTKRNTVLASDQTEANQIASAWVQANVQQWKWNLFETTVTAIHSPRFPNS